MSELEIQPLTDDAGTVFKPRINADALTMIGKSASFLAEARAVKIGSRADAENASRQFKTLGDANRQLESARVAHKAPVNAIAKSIDQFFRPAKARISEARDIIQGKISDFEAGQAEKRAKIEAEIDPAATEPADAAAAIAKLSTVAPSRAADGVRSVTRYSARVDDLRALVAAWLAGEVDSAAIIADEKYLNGLARQQKQDFKLPGVALVEKTRLEG